MNPSLLPRRPVQLFGAALLAALALGATAQLITQNNGSKQKNVSRR